MRTWRTWLGDGRAVALQFVLLIAAGGVWMAPAAQSWRGSWKQALDLGAGATGLIGPVAAGMACVAYARLRRSSMSDLLLQSPRDQVRWLQPGLAVWAMACTALVVVTVAATTLSSLSGVPSYWSWAWIVLPSLVMLGAQTAIGAAIGFASGRPWLAPLAVVVVYSLFLLTAVGVFPEVFSTGGLTGPISGVTFAVWPILSPGIAAAGIAVCVLAACQRRIFLATWPRRVLVASGVLAWCVGWFLAPGDSDVRYVALADPPLTCTGSQPQVCVHEETTRPLEDYSRRMHRQAAALIDLGITMPDRFVPSIAGNGRATDGDLVLLDLEASSTVTDDLATDSLVRPSSVCPADYGPEPPYLAFEARHLLGRWLQVQAGIITPAADDRDHAWLTSDLAVQEPWVRTTYRQLTECAFDQLRLPDGLG